MTATQINFSTGELVSIQDSNILVNRHSYYSIDIPEDHPLANLGTNYLRLTEFYTRTRPYIFKLEILSIHSSVSHPSTGVQTEALKIELWDAYSRDLSLAFHASLQDQDKLWEKELIPAYTKFFRELDEDYVDAQEAWAKYLVEKLRTYISK